MEKYRGIQFKCLAKLEQIRLANRLDQDDGCGKDYVVFQQTLEKLCNFSFGVVMDWDALKVLRSRGDPTMALFQKYYTCNPNITLDLVYSVLIEMGLEDCTAVLDESWEDIRSRHESGQCIRTTYYEAWRPYAEQHRCTCESCRPYHSVEHETGPSTYTTQLCQPPRMTDPPSNTNISHPGLHPIKNVRPPFPPPPVVLPQHSPHFFHPDDHRHLMLDGMNITDRDNPSREGQNWVQCGPAVTRRQEVQDARFMPHDEVPSSRYQPHNEHTAQISTSTVQLPFYQGSSLKTPVTQVSNLPGTETGAIPKREHVSISDDSPLSPLAQQSRADNRPRLHRTNSSPHRYSSGHGQNEPQTLRNHPADYHRHPADYHRHPPHVNDLDKGNVQQSRPVCNSQCTCPTSVGAEYPTTPAASAYPNGGNRFRKPDTQTEWFAPSDSEDDESEQTKLLEVVGSSVSSSQCTCESLNPRATNSRQSGNKPDAERRKSDPQDSSSSSNNCSDVCHVRRSSSDEELKRNNLSPRGSVQSSSSNRQIKLFLTFADDSEGHLEEVLALGAQLKEMGFSVKCDMFDQTIQKLIKQPISLEMQNSIQQFFSNTNDWLDHQVHHAAYIVFCISPKYFQYVRPQEQIYANNNLPAHHSVRGAHGMMSGEAHPTNCQLHAKYIYNQACNEHFHTLAQNKRFFPVLFQNSGATPNHIPNIFKSTLIFNYPDPHSSLVTFLSSQHAGRYMQ